MERTPSNFNIVKVLEKKKKRIIIPVIKGTIEIPFSMYVHKRTFIPPFNAIDLYKKKEKRKTENLDDSGKIEKIPIDGSTQRIKTSIVEKISLRPPRLVVNS